MLSYAGSTSTKANPVSGQGPPSSTGGWKDLEQVQRGGGGSLGEGEPKLLPLGPCGGHFLGSGPGCSFPKSHFLLPRSDLSWGCRKAGVMEHLGDSEA